MAASSSFSMTDNRVPNFIFEQLQVLRKKVELFFEKEESLSKKQQRKLCRFKSSVTRKINLIEKVLKETHFPLTPQLVNADADAPIAPRAAKRRRGAAQANDTEVLSNVQLSSSMIEDETNESRYLLVSNGCVICLLDLKLRKDEQPLCKAADYAAPLPKIATLKLIENKLPVSVGLFKLGTDAYMIGGHEFPTDWKPSRPYSNDSHGGFSLYKALLDKECVKGTSRATYRISLDDDGTLIQSKCKIKKLKSPNFWPIVEEIDGQIHVMDSAPDYFCRPASDWKFSHEVLERDGCCWNKIPITGVSKIKNFIESHIVLGNSIYAVSGQAYLAFDIEKKNWEVSEQQPDPYDEPSAFTGKLLWDILSHGVARCAGKIRIIGSEPLYVVIAIVWLRQAYYDDECHLRDNDLDDPCTCAMTCLVRSTGQVLCRQRLRHFSKGPLKPFHMTSGTMIKVDAGGKTMCSIVSASHHVNGYEAEFDGRDYVFINKFTVEMLPGAASKLRKHLESGGRMPSCYMNDLVRVVVKDSYIFKTDAHLTEEGDFTNDTYFPGLQACFI